jgi:spermidine synthase
VTFCFFVSGIAGLGYEVLWVRLFDKMIGSAPFAVATVISVIMAGMGLGSWLVGRFVKPSAGPSVLLSLYGKLELGIGFWALLVPFCIAAGRPFFRVFYDRLAEQFWCYELITVAACALILIIPAACMGATLPVLCRFFIADRARIGSVSGRLYGLNTLGAGLGSILCGFFLIRYWGTTATLYFFVGINFMVGAGCLFLSRLFPKTREAVPARGGVEVDPASSAVPDANSSRKIFWALAIFIVSGFCSMAYEVLWMRLLSLLIGPTTYSFTLVVSTFIIGLAAGSILFGRLADKSRAPLSMLLATQTAAAVSAMAVSQLLGTSQFFFAKLIHGQQEDFSQLMGIQTGVLALALLPVTIFLGAAFPLVNRLYVRSTGSIVRSLGAAYALNTAGAIFGSFAAGFLLIPIFGMEHALRLVLFLQLAVVLSALVFSGTLGTVVSKPAKIAALTGLAGVLLVSCLFPSWPREQLSRGWYRNFQAIEDSLEQTGWLGALLQGPEKIAAQRQGLEVVFQGEGKAGFTTVEKEVTSLGTIEYAMFNSGKADASSHGDRSTQALSAHIPMLFHKNAKEVMVLGLASGMTAGECLLYPLTHLDIVEINRQVIAAADRFFSPWNNGCLDDPRSRILVQDGRNHLALTHNTYDVIISEPSNPWMAGLANLYSREFFELARNRLNPDGIFAQWIQAYEMDWQTFCLLGRTFAAVFPQGALIKIGPVDYLMLGTTDPTGNFDWSVAAAHLPFAGQSTNVAMPGVGFLAQLILTEDLPGLFGAGPVHSDEYPHLEFLAPQKLNTGTLDIDALVAPYGRLNDETADFKRTHSDVDTFLDLIDFSASAGVPVFNLLRWETLSTSQQSRYRQILHDYCRRFLLPSYSIVTDPVLKAECAQIQAEAMAAKIERGATAVDHYNHALAQIAMGDQEGAILSLRQACKIEPDNEPALTALGLLLAERGSLDEASELFARLTRLFPGEASFHRWLGLIHLRRGEHAAALEELRKARSIAPDDQTIADDLNAALSSTGE